jgi:hypothetical protein
MTKDVLEPGNYAITVTINYAVYIDADDQFTESDLLEYARRSGEVVDWDIQKV